MASALSTLYERPHSASRAALGYAVARANLASTLLDVDHALPLSGALNGDLFGGYLAGLIDGLSRQGSDLSAAAAQVAAMREFSLVRGMEAPTFFNWINVALDQAAVRGRIDRGDLSRPFALAISSILPDDEHISGVFSLMISRNWIPGPDRARIASLLESFDLAHSLPCCPSRTAPSL